MTLRVGQTFSPIQNDRKVQETAQNRDEDEANKHRSQHAVETTTEVAAQKTVETHNEVQKVVEAKENPRSTRSTRNKTTIPTL